MSQEHDPSGTGPSDSGLLQEHGLLQALYDSMSEGLCLHRLSFDEAGEPVDYVITGVNRAYERILGIERERALGMRASELYGAGVAPFLDIYAKVARTGEPTSFETYFPPLERHFRISVFSPAEGCFATLFLDITEDRHRVEALREAHRRNTALLEAIPDLMFRLDAEGTFLDYKSPRGDLLALPPESFVGRRAEEVFPGPFGREVRQHVQTTLEKNDVHTYDYELMLPSGELHYFEGRMVPEGDREVVAIVRDVTERRQGLKALEAERELLSVTLQSIGDALISTDTEGRVVLINPVAEDLTGWSSSEARGRPLSEVFHIVNEMTRERCTDPVSLVLGTGRVVGLANHTALVARDGTEHVIEDSGAPVRDRAGEIVGVVLVFRDITEKRELEDEAQRARTLASLGVMAGGIAHDFNNILTVISGNVSLARTLLSPEDETQAHLQEAETAATRARDLTAQLLAFSKGGAPVRRTGRISETLLEAARFALRGSDVALETSISEDLWRVDYDHGQIGRVFHNLVMNADQAMPSGGSLLITAENVVATGAAPLALPAGNYVRIAFTDEGTGIAAPHLDDIFDPYFTTKESGSGLGLAICHAVVRRHEGLLTVDSTPGEGATFTVYLPAAPFSQEGVEKTRDPPQPGEGRILVVDDEPSIRSLAEAMLQELGYEPTTVADGALAIDTWREAAKQGAPFRAVILDLTVPGGMGGKEALAGLRELDPHVVAVASSGYSTDPIMAEYEEYGFDAALAKPYTVDEMGRALERALWRGRSKR